MMSANDYPKFSRSDIITVLREANIASVKDADLKNPTFDSVSDLYTRILIYLDVLTEEERGQVDFEALEQLENPDHHTTSAPAMDLYDLLRPDSSRTEFFISALLNYSLHKDSKMELIRPLAEELTLLDEQRRQSEAKIAQLKAEIAEFEEAEEKDSPFVQELEVSIEELSHKIAQLNNEQLSLRATFHKLREESAEMDNKISKAEFDLVQAVQENANLRSLIVQSPDKLQGVLEEKKLVLEETKKAERLAMETFEEKAAILEVYEKAFKKMSKSSAQLQLINEQVTNVKAIEKDLKAQKTKLNEDETLYKSLEAKVVERERTGKHWSIYLPSLEIIETLEKEKQVMFDDWTKQLNDLKLEVESRRRLLESRQNDVESVVAMVDENTAKANQVKQSGQAKVKQLADKYEEIVKQFHEYTVKFGAVLPSL
ncbi:hypothetical protein HID58_013771 [Brassica napus]|uniref:Kinetochore protein Nuf2 N-terminal domain-containing protein n=1 Tax=Brassica napus TaxID=3708 RepID=A0ABQ7XHI3_BRANA|nr:hypothetical protein HID58_013771 [Brassica napus]